MAKGIHKGITTGSPTKAILKGITQGLTTDPDANATLVSLTVSPNNGPAGDNFAVLKTLP